MYSPGGGIWSIDSAGYLSMYSAGGIGSTYSADVTLTDEAGSVTTSVSVTYIEV